MRHITSFAAIVGDLFKPSYASIRAVSGLETWKMSVFESKSWFLQFSNHFETDFFFSANLIDESYHIICAFGLYKF